MSYISKIVIEFLNQEKYDKLVSFIRGAGAVKLSGLDSGEPIYKIRSVEEVYGNPPIYKNIEIKITDISNIDKEGVEKVKKSLKGLVDLLN